MAGLLPTEGKTLIIDLIFKNGDVNRGTGLQLGLFTNSSISSSTTYSALTEPTGGSYARIALTDASWSVASNVASYAAQTFTATGSAYTGSVYGYFICTTGTSPKILAIEADSSGPFTFLQNDTYVITPTITLS